MKSARLIISYLFVISIAGLLYVNIFNSVVDAPNWGREIPQSIQTARDYYQAANPGSFYRFFSPLNQLLALLLVIVTFSGGKKLRALSIAAFLLALGIDAFTFGYFYPRNNIMFASDLGTNLENIKLAWAEWSSMNWWRSILCAADLFLAVVISRKLQGPEAP